MPAWESWVRRRNPSPPGMKISSCVGRSAPPDSTRLTSGSRFSSAISIARRLLRSEYGFDVPPRTVGSLAMIMHSTPSTTPTPVTMLAPTLKSVPYAANGESSRNGESRSTSSSMRSRASSLPRVRWRSRYFSPPPMRVSSSSSSSTTRRSSIAVRLRAYSSEERSTLVVITGTAGWEYARMADVLRIANCSGFYGDRFSAAREMVQDGPIDVLTGEYLAELTMLILWRTRESGRGEGWANTFLRQLEEVLGTCAERGIKVVSNAGGLNPAGLADRIRALAGHVGVDVSVAHVEGDDLMGRLGKVGIDGSPVTANPYPGGFGIAEALRGGADVVVTGRVTDASLVVGPG